MKSIRKIKRTTKGVERRYERLFRSLNQADTKVVLSLGGGGVRMVAHLPVLQFLEDMGVASLVSEVWGASGGAFVGLPYTWGLSPERIEKAMLDIFLGSKGAVRLKPSLLSIAKSIARESLFSSEHEADIAGFHDHVHFQDAVHKMLEGYRQKVPLYCLAYNLGTHRTDVLTPSPVPEGLYDGWMFHTDALEAVSASTAVPIVFRPRHISDGKGRRVYVDGATNEEIPTVSVHRKWCIDHELGLEKRHRLLVVAVNLNPQLTTMGLFRHWAFRKIPIVQHIRSTLYYADLMRRAKVEDQRRVLLSDPQVEYWEISLPLKGDMLDQRLMPKILAYAKKEVPRQFARINDSLLM